MSNTDNQLRGIKNRENELVSLFEPQHLQHLVSLTDGKIKVYLKTSCRRGFLSKYLAPFDQMLRRPKVLISKLVRKVVFSEADDFLFQRVPFFLFSKIKPFSKTFAGRSFGGLVNSVPEAFYAVHTPTVVH